MLITKAVPRPTAVPLRIEFSGTGSSVDSDWQKHQSVPVVPVNPLPRLSRKKIIRRNVGVGFQWDAGTDCRIPLTGTLLKSVPLTISALGRHWDGKAALADVTQWAEGRR